MERHWVVFPGVKKLVCIWKKQSQRESLESNKLILNQNLKYTKNIKSQGLITKTTKHVKKYKNMTHRPRNNRDDGINKQLP